MEGKLRKRRQVTQEKFTKIQCTITKKAIVGAEAIFPELRDPDHHSPVAYRWHDGQVLLHGGSLGRFLLAASLSRDQVSQFKDRRRRLLLRLLLPQAGDSAKAGAVLHDDAASTTASGFPDAFSQEIEKPPTAGSIKRCISKIILLGEIPLQPKPRPTRASLSVDLRRHAALSKYFDAEPVQVLTTGPAPAVPATAPVEVRAPPNRQVKRVKREAAAFGGRDLRKSSCHSRSLSPLPVLDRPPRAPALAPVPKKTGGYDHYKSRSLSEAVEAGGTVSRKKGVVLLQTRERRPSGNCSQSCTSTPAVVSRCHSAASGGARPRSDEWGRKVSK